VLPDTNVGWRIFERWSGTAFLTGGGLLLAYTTLVGLETFTSVSAPGWVGGLLSGFGLVAPLVGLLGFYPRLADHIPRLARTCAAVLSAAAAAVVVTTVWGVGVELLAETTGTDISSPPSVALVASLGLVALGVLLVSIASLWTDTPSRAVGTLLLTVVGVNVVYFVAVAVYGAARPEWLNFIVTGAHPLLFLAIGYVLQTASVSTTNQVQSGDSIA
jgi:hypothetical protein